MWKYQKPLNSAISLLKLAEVTWKCQELPESTRSQLERCRNNLAKAKGIWQCQKPLETGKSHLKVEETTNKVAKAIWKCQKQLDSSRNHWTVPAIVTWKPFASARSQPESCRTNLTEAKAVDSAKSYLKLAKAIRNASVWFNAREVNNYFHFQQKISVVKVEICLKPTSSLIAFCLMTENNRTQK